MVIYQLCDLTLDLFKPPSSHVCSGDNFTCLPHTVTVGLKPGGLSTDGTHAGPTEGQGLPFSMAELLPGKGQAGSRKGSLYACSSWSPLSLPRPMIRWRAHLASVLRSLGFRGEMANLCLAFTLSPSPPAVSLPELSLGFATKDYMSFPWEQHIP